MNNKLGLISQKSDDIQFGLLRFNNKGAQKTMQVRTAVADDHLLNCIIINDYPDTRLLNRNVSLIQKNHDDYLYISGHISGEVQNTSKIVSIYIKKACWFTRKKKGNVTWLQEKYIYENLERPMASWIVYKFRDWHGIFDW